jgi:diguanylate cyclase (GGDEF)-like protein/PAS domain S-box-containing protein
VSQIGISLASVRAGKLYTPAPLRYYLYPFLTAVTKVPNPRAAHEQGQRPLPNPTGLLRKHTRRTRAGFLPDIPCFPVVDRSLPLWRRAWPRPLQPIAASLSCDRTPARRLIFLRNASMHDSDESGIDGAPSCAPRSRYMKRYYLVAAASTMVLLLVGACVGAGALTWRSGSQIAAMIVLVIVAFRVIFGSGVNMRCHDRSLTLAQMTAATLVVFYALYEAQFARAAFLIVLLMIYMFGMLGLSTRTLLRFAAAILGGYAVLICLLLRIRPDSVDLRLEGLLWLAMAITLPSFAWMGGLIGTLRRRARDSNGQLQQLLARVQGSEASLRQAQRIAQVGSWSFDPASRTASWSHETYRLFGIDPATAAPVGERFLALLDVDHRAYFNRVIRRALQEGLEFDEQFRLRSGKWLHARARPIVDAAGALAALSGTVMDITDRKEREDEINRLAHYDVVTGLPNRRLLMQRLTAAMSASTRSRHHCAILFIDLDNFKTINDLHGHDKGDQLLQAVATRLLALVGAEDGIAARIGGDEFVVMLSNLSVLHQQALEQAAALARSLLASLGEPCDFLGQAHHSTASIGAAVFQGTLVSAGARLKQADMAMYQAKAAGRNAVRMFAPDMEVNARRRADLAAALYAGWHARQFVPYFQAQIDASGAVSGAELLLRWHDPARGVIEPAEFIPLAEQIGLIVPLGSWVLEAACQQLACWAGQPSTARLTLAVNVSAAQLRAPEFVTLVEQALARTGANPQLLKLELTESMLLNDVAAVTEKMLALKAKGVGFALDDFGTGYCSLAYLQRLPLDQIKIDRSFVRDITGSASDRAIVRAIVNLAHSLGFEVLAEGVETAAQLEVLGELGCHAHQGYLVGKPVPVDTFVASLAAAPAPRARAGGIRAV